MKKNFLKKRKIIKFFSLFQFSSNAKGQFNSDSQQCLESFISQGIFKSCSLKYTLLLQSNILRFLLSSFLFGVQNSGVLYSMKMMNNIRQVRRKRLTRSENTYDFSYGWNSLIRDSLLQTSWPLSISVDSDDDDDLLWTRSYKG